MVAGLLVQLLSVFPRSLGLVLIKRYSAKPPSLSITTGALLLAVPLFLLTGLALDGQAPAALPARAMGAIVYLGIVGSVVGFALYFFVLKRMPANTASLITLITPVAALLIGSAFNGERIGARAVTGTAAVLTGLALHQWGGRLARAGRRGGRSRHAVMVARRDRQPSASPSPVGLSTSGNGWSSGMSR